MSQRILLSAATAATLLLETAFAAEYLVRKVPGELASRPTPAATGWNGIVEAEIGLMAQMIAKPNPEKAYTTKAKVQIIHDGKRIAFRMRWSDPEVSEAGKLGEYSDAIALQFPVLDNAAPPPIFMGAPGNPVHIFHWRVQYQADEERGMKTIKDIYPNLHSDIYPNEFPDRGRLKHATQGEVEMFSTAVAAGNPQAYSKKAVDEMKAEGFGTSVVLPPGDAAGRGEWKDGEWTVVISRPLACAGGSILESGKASAYGLAVWQGGQGEVGSRKSITMVWVPFKLGGE